MDKRIVCSPNLDQRDNLGSGSNIVRLMGHFGENTGNDGESEMELVGLNRPRIVEKAGDSPIGFAYTARMSRLHDARMQLRQEVETPRGHRPFGSGWVSGMLGLVLGVAGLFLVLALRFPRILAMPETRPLQDNVWFRLGLHVMLIGAFVLALLSLVLRKGKALGTTGAAAVLLAGLIGGSQARAFATRPAPFFLGLDWFVLNVMFTGLLFIPLERIFPRSSEQEIFRSEWRGGPFLLPGEQFDGADSYLSDFLAAKTIVAFIAMTQVRAWVAALPFLVQFAAIMFLTDLVQYGCTARSIKCLAYGNFMRCIIRQKAWIGWRERGCIFWRFSRFAA